MVHKNTKHKRLRIMNPINTSDEMNSGAPDG